MVLLKKVSNLYKITEREMEMAREKASGSILSA
jgi:hypothetical protein